MKTKIALMLCIIIMLLTASFTASKAINQTKEVYSGNPLIYAKQMDWPIIIGCLLAIVVACVAWHFIKEFEKFSKED